MPALVEYIPNDSLFHRLNPITKILWTFTVIVFSFMFDVPLVIFCVFASNLVIAAFSGILKQVMPAVKGLLIFSLLLILFQIFFVADGNTLFYAIPYLNIGRITDIGLDLSMVMALRMLSTVSTIPILMMTTQMTDIVAVMVEKFRVPFKYAFMFVTALKFIPVFTGEMEQILQAQMSRGYNSDTKNPFKKFMIIIPLAIPLLVSSVKKTEKMAVSMEARGFGSGPRSHYREISMNSPDYITIAVFAVLVVSAALLHSL